MNKVLAYLYRRAEDALAPVSIQSTWDPKGPGVIRLHLVRPPQSLIIRRPYLLHINGQHILPLNHGFATLLRLFMVNLKESVKTGQEPDQEMMKQILTGVVNKMHNLYPEAPKTRFVKDLVYLQDLIQRVAYGQTVTKAEAEVMSSEDYTRSFRAPVRMDLAVAPMRINGKWSCPLHCHICYANQGEAMKVTDEEMLTTKQWYKVLDRLWKIGVTQVSFTGGDPLTRSDIIDLVKHAENFTTRLNTQAVLLTEEIAAGLAEADLDVMQVTFYSSNPAIHDLLVGTSGAWQQTVRGIKIAINAGIDVSINTPLVAENAAGYVETLQFLHQTFGLRYFTASGMLPAGGAIIKAKAGGGVPQDKLFTVMQAAKSWANTHNCELDFTSPGTLRENQLQSLGMNVPVCGASFTNMAIAPDGEVLPCQSSVHNKKSLGNILKVSWKQIWNHKLSAEIRNKAGNKPTCPLAEEK